MGQKLLCKGCRVGSAWPQDVIIKVMIAGMQRAGVADGGGVIR